MKRRTTITSLARKTEKGFEQLVVANAAALKLTLKEVRNLRRRIERLERKANRPK